MNDSTRPNVGEFLGALASLIVLLACLFVPWVVQFTVGWWAAYPAFFALVALYDWLFVPKGSLCMGVPFGLVLGSFLVLVVFDVMVLVRWLLSWIA